MGSLSFFVEKAVFGTCLNMPLYVKTLWIDKVDNSENWTLTIIVNTNNEAQDRLLSNLTIFFRHGWNCHHGSKFQESNTKPL